MTKVAGIALVVCMLSGSASVLALEPDTADMSRMTSATPITYGQTVHVEFSKEERGQWFSFIPAETETYYFYSSDSQNDPIIYLYDSNGNKLARDDEGNETGHDFGLAKELQAGTTYYLWCSDYYNNPDSYDFTVTWGCGITGIISVEYDGVTTDIEDHIFNISEGIDPDDIDLRILLDDDTLNPTYQWYRKSYISCDYEPIPGQTASTLTVGDLGDQFRCVISVDGIPRRYEFDVYNDYHQSPTMYGVVYSLGAEGQPATVVLPGVDDPSADVHYLAGTASARWMASYGGGYTEYNVEGADFSEDTTLVLPPFTVTTLYDAIAMEDYYQTNHFFDYTWSKPIYEYQMFTNVISFVRRDGNSGTLALDQTQQVDLSRVLPDESVAPVCYDLYNIGYTDCKVLSYTPTSAGTYTLRSSDIEAGNPFVALFDSDYSFIAYNDNIDGSYSFGVGFTGVTSDKNFTLTQHLNGGQTYYYVVWSSDTISTSDQEEPVTAQYNIRLTCDSLDTFNVRVTSGGHGSASASTSSGVGGTQVDLTATPDSGYHFVSWEVISGGVSISSNRFSIGNSNVEIRANFAADPVIPPANNAPVTETGVAGFVERLYTIALGRPSDPVGKQDWIDAITLRGETGASCARGFLYSPEFLNKGVSNEEFVAVLYRTFFNREPDQDGFNAWVGVLNNGTSKEEVIEGFINSTEWANLCLFYGIRNGGTGVPNIEIEPNQATIDFATRLYTTCLGRNADQAGLMAWARQLANQRDTGTGAARGFFFSSEFTGQNVSNGEYVTRLYRTFMNREPDQAGYDAWVAQLDAGASREEVFEGFAQSPEFARICASYGIIR